MSRPGLIRDVSGYMHPFSRALDVSGMFKTLSPRVGGLMRKLGEPCLCKMNR